MITAARCTAGKPAEEVEVIVGEHSRVNIYNGTVMTRVGVKSIIEDPAFTNKSGCIGGDDCCTTTNPCNVGEGDCDSDIQCLGDLKCGENNNFDDNCVGEGFDATDDCCYDPNPKGFNYSSLSSLSLSNINFVCRSYW